MEQTGLLCAAPPLPRAAGAAEPDGNAIRGGVSLPVGPHSAIRSKCSLATPHILARFYIES